MGRGARIAGAAGAVALLGAVLLMAVRPLLVERVEPAAEDGSPGAGGASRATAPGTIPGPDHRPADGDAPTEAPAGDGVVAVRVVDGRDRPVARARVEAFATEVASAGPPAAALFREPVALARASTGADGLASLVGLPAGDVRLRAAADGFAPAETHVTPCAAGASGPAVLVLLRGHDLSGTVHTPAGVPLAGATVLAWRAGPEVGGPPPDASAPVAADGSFRLRGLEEGTWPLYVRRADGVILGGERHRVPRERPVALVVGGDASILLRAMAAGDGRPVGGATVALHVFPSNPTEFRHDLADAVVITGDDGAARVEGLPGGDWWARVHHPAYAPWSTSEWTERVLLEGEVLETVARLLPGASLAGRVLAEQGAPVPDARVSLFHDDWRDEDPDDESARTDAAGAFRIAGVRPGPVSLHVEAPGFVPAGRWAGGDAEGDGETDLRATLAAGGETTIEIRLARGATVAGVVVDASGSPVAGAPVNGVRTDAAGRFRVGGRVPGEETWIGTALPDGREAWITVTPTGSGPSEDVRLVLEEPARVRGRLRRADGAALAEPELRVAPADDDRDADPVPGSGFSGEAHAVAADGTFSVPARRDTRLLLVARDRGTALGIVHVETGTDTSAPPVEILLPLELVVHGRVVDASGAGVPGAVVELLAAGAPGPGRIPPADAAFDRAWTPLLAQTVAADGSFRFGGLSPGAVILRARGADGASVEGGAEATGPPVTLTLERRDVVAGVVVDAGSGAPLAGARVTVDKADGPSTGGAAPPGESLAYTGTDGRFRVAVPAGQVSRVEISARAGPGGVADHFDESVDDVAAGTEDLRIALRRGLAISGVLVPPPDVPAGAILTVTAEGDEGGYAWGTVRLEHGPTPFRVAPVEEGTHAIEVEAAYDDESLWFPKVRVEGIAAGTADARIVLPAGKPVTGRVVADGWALPVEQALVYVLRNGGARDEDGTDDRAVAEDGTFTTAALPAGTTCSLEAWFTKNGEPVGLGARVDGVAAGATGVVLRIPRGETISGRVTDADGQPAEGVEVAARAERRDAAEGARSVAWTASDGTFTLAGLREGAYRVLCNGSEDFLPAPAQRGVAAGTTGVAFSLRRAATLAGRLVDGSGRATGGGRLLAVRAGGGELAGVFVRDDGAFAIRGLEPGPVTLAFQRDVREPAAPLGTVTAPASGLELVVPAQAPK